MLLAPKLSVLELEEVFNFSYPFKLFEIVGHRNVFCNELLLRSIDSLDGPGLGLKLLDMPEVLVGDNLVLDYFFYLVAEDLVLFESGTLLLGDYGQQLLETGVARVLILGWHFFNGHLLL